MKIIDDNGTEIEISEETAQNIRDARNPEDREKRFGYIRVSLIGLTYMTPYGWPIRVSILDNAYEGQPMGEGFDKRNPGKLPGGTITQEQARAMAHYLLELCDELEKK